MQDREHIKPDRPAGEQDAVQPELIAFCGLPRPAMQLVPAPRWREWMNETKDRWANRCLPLLMANEAGWVLLNPFSFAVTWGGDAHPSSTKIEFLDDDDVPLPRPVENYFGYGIITWGIPYLFRTPPGWNLLARGPANWPKDGACALEGLVETDWSVATFTMNWKLTRPDHTVTFEAGEPFCMVVPRRRGELESFHPVARNIASDPDTHAAVKRWAEGRHEMRVQKFLSEYSRDFETAKTAWQRHYFKGTSPDGEKAPEHQTKLDLPGFADEL